MGAKIKWIGRGEGEEANISGNINNVGIQYMYALPLWGMWDTLKNDFFSSITIMFPKMCTNVNLWGWVGWDLVSECRESQFIRSHSILPCQWLLVAFPSFLISVISGAGWDIISWHKGGFEVPARQRQESSCRWLPTRPLPWQLLLLVIVDEANDQLAQGELWRKRNWSALEAKPNRKSPKLSTNQFQNHLLTNSESVRPLWIFYST